MIKSVMNLTKTLISIPSTQKNPQTLQEVLQVALAGVKNFTIERFEKNGVPSALVYNSKTRPKRFKVIFNAHLDVVPAKEKQFKPYQKENKLFGRGAYDMKAAAAVEILVFAQLAQSLPYPLGLQLVTDEEIGGFNGTKYQIEKGVQADFIIAGEPTDFGINNQAKGIIWAKIKTKGEAAHGAYLWQGKNAIWQMKKILDQLEKIYPPPKKEVWQTTVNLAKIETSNQTFNKVPDDCLVSLDIRYIPEDKEKIISQLKKIIAKKGEIEIILKEPCASTSEKNPFLIALKKATEKITNHTPSIIVKHGGSDIRHFNQVGCAGVTFGPEGFGLHTDNEWVDIKSLEKYYQILKEFLLSLK